jgi:aminopeptidase-like protein
VNERSAQIEAGSEPIGSLRAGLDHEVAGREMHALASELYRSAAASRAQACGGPSTCWDAVCRWSAIASRAAQVFDWTVANGTSGTRGSAARRASGSSTSRATTFVVSYSEPMHARMPLAALRPRRTLPARRWIHAARLLRRTRASVSSTSRPSLSDGEYEVCIDASLEDGLDWSSCSRRDLESALLLPRVLPSLANDNLSSLAVATSLAQLCCTPASASRTASSSRDDQRDRLARRERQRARASDRDGAGLPRRRGPSWKRSRGGNREIDRAVEFVLRGSGRKWEARPFTPYGYDERQYGSPGFDLPVGRLTRTPNGEYPEYHTSADDLTLIRPEALADSLDMLLRILEVVEGDRVYVNTQPLCEPQLGRRGLYGPLGGLPDPGAPARDALVLTSRTAITRCSTSPCAQAALRARADRGAVRRISWSSRDGREAPFAGSIVPDPNAPFRVLALGAPATNRNGLRRLSCSLLAAHRNLCFDRSSSRRTRCAREAQASAERFLRSAGEAGRAEEFHPRLLPDQWRASRTTSRRSRRRCDPTSSSHHAQDTGTGSRSSPGTRSATT